MSAFMLSKEHIDLIVGLAINGPRGVAPRCWSSPYFNGERVSEANANDIGEMLVKENLSSIHSRYPDTLTNPENTPGPFDQYWMAPYQFEDQRYRFTVVEAFSAISCYEYQSCEHPEWKDSKALEFCEGLRHALARCLPGWSDSPWEWTSDQIAKMRVKAY